MHIQFFLTTLLVVAEALAMPVQSQPTGNGVLQVRQLGELGALTGMLKGIMDQDKGAQASPTLAVSASSSSSSSSLKSNYQDYSDTIQQIEEAIDTSERDMKASGNEPTINNIQPVLAIMSDTLGDDCSNGAMTPEDLSGTASVDALEGKTAQGCSDCKRRLYIIVKGLQTILAMSQQGRDDMTSAVGGGLSSSTVPTTISSAIVATTTMTMTMMSMSTTMILA